VTIKAEYEVQGKSLLRDARPWTTRIIDASKKPSNAAIVMAMMGIGIYIDPYIAMGSDVIFLFACLYFWWLMSRPVVLPYKLPKSAQRKDPNFKQPDGKLGMADGILYLGNDQDSGEEVWFTNSDARTHCLYLGTTGSGKTFGLKSYACNALCWASGFVYIDGKADTSLWSTISAMCRRFGRDDDLLIMNYMTGNVSGRVPSNTMNPFSSGSASYLTNMLVSLMPDSEGDNAMWKDRAVALVSALMPCMVWKRENQNMPLSIGVIRHYLTFKAVIKLSRDQVIPDSLRAAIRGYLNELPGYVDHVFDDEGNEKPMPPDAGMVDTSVPRQQHGYLSMQFTRSMQSLGDDYGFIFDTQAADVDMLDVVLNRRILITLIPALEKSGDETANLGKIISSTLKGMMGATLGNTVEGESATVIDNKPTNSATPFIAIFDEVGYYTAAGMAVMAAQARSLGFSLVFAGQDLPALEKRVKEEARSITANCNIKLFGKLEDPTQTKEFFEKTVGTTLVTKVQGYERGGQQGGGSGYMESKSVSTQEQARASYDMLKGFTEGRAVCAFGKGVREIQIYNSHIGDAKAMRVHRFLPIPPPAEEALESLRLVNVVLQRLRNPKWDPDAVQIAPNPDIEALARGFAQGKKSGGTLVECGINGVAAVAEAHKTIKPEDAAGGEATSDPTKPHVPQPINPQAEAVAVATVQQATANKGPLSWTEVIGLSDASASPIASAGAGAAAGSGAGRADPPVTEAPPAKPVSWDDVISGGGQQAQAAAQAASSAALGAPLSWMDVIGGAEATVGANAVAEQAAQLSGQTAPAAQTAAAPAADALPPAGLPDAAQKPAQPFSWADVIGGGDAAEKSDSGEAAE
jgi:intracellular multiplication protein IcmO